MKLIITMTAYRRVGYTRQVLEALSKCVGIEDCMLYANCEPGYPAIHKMLAAWDSCPSCIARNSTRLGLNRNSLAVMTRAHSAKPDGIIHIEDDTVLSPDALDYYRWGLENYGDHPAVFSIAGYNKPKKQPTDDVKHQVRFRKWFTCWGWAVTYKRLCQILAGWSSVNPKSFAWHVNLKIRNDRHEMHPQLSRVQNIGYQHGENGRSAKWYRDNHRTPWVSTYLRPGEWWRQKGEAGALPV